MAPPGETTTRSFTRSRNQRIAVAFLAVDIAQRLTNCTADEMHEVEREVKRLLGCAPGTAEDVTTTSSGRPRQSSGVGRRRTPSPSTATSWRWRS